MDSLQRSLKLKGGATITVKAWGIASFATALSDYRQLIVTLRARAAAPDPEPGADEALQTLIGRVVASSVPKAEDAGLLQVHDLGNLLELIHDLNDVDGVTGKPLGLYARLVQAMNAHLTSSSPN